MAEAGPTMHGWSSREIHTDDFPGGPALGVIELSSIARGVVVVDALVKRAEVTLIASRPGSGGKHLVIFGGEVDVVEVSRGAGRAGAGGAPALVDRLLVPLLFAPLWKLIAAADGHHPDAWTSGPVGAVAIVETTTVCAAVEAADAAGKAAPVALRDMRLGMGIGGKAFFTMTGTLSDVEAAVDAARGAARPERLVQLEVIAQPAAELVGRLIFG